MAVAVAEAGPHPALEALGAAEQLGAALAEVTGRLEAALAEKERLEKGSAYAAVQRQLRESSRSLAGLQSVHGDLLEKHAATAREHTLAHSRAARAEARNRELQELLHLKERDLKRLARQLAETRSEHRACRARCEGLERELHAQEEYLGSFQELVMHEHDRELESLRIDFEARALKYREEIRQWRAAVQNAILTSSREAADLKSARLMVELGAGAGPTTADGGGGGGGGGGPCAWDMKELVKRLYPHEREVGLQGLKEVASTLTSDAARYKFVEHGGLEALGRIVEEPTFLNYGDAKASVVYVLDKLAETKAISFQVWTNFKGALFAWLGAPAGDRAGDRETRRMVAGCLMSVFAGGVPPYVKGEDAEGLLSTGDAHLLVDIASADGGDSHLRYCCMECISAALAVPLKRHEFYSRAMYAWLLRVVRGPARALHLVAFRLLSQIFADRMSKERAINEFALEAFEDFLTTAEDPKAVSAALEAVTAFADGADAVSERVRKLIVGEGLFKVVCGRIRPGAAAPVCISACTLLRALCLGSESLIRKVCDNGTLLRVLNAYKGSAAGDDALRDAAVQYLEVVAGNRQAQMYLIDNGGFGILLQAWHSKERCAQAALRALMKGTDSPKCVTAMQLAGLVPTATKHITANFKNEADVAEALRLLLEASHLPLVQREIEERGSQSALKSVGACYGGSCRGLAQSLLRAGAAS